jgi:methylenetetrahydrofolate reductase (NADPH)
VIEYVRRVVESLTRAHLTPGQEAGLRRLLETPRYEMVPVKGARAQIEFLPVGASVSVTASPTRSLDDTLDLCGALVDAGHDAVPHLAARMVRDDSHLASLLERIDRLGISEVFVIGGDARDAGEFSEAKELMAAMARIGSGVDRIGVAGYPEGHHIVDDDVALDALRAKQAQATSVTTQLCFDSKAVLRWIADMREQGMTLPVVVGVAGVADRRKLLGISARIGVGQSVRYLSKNRGVVTRLLRPGGYTPGHLLEGLAPAMVEPSAAIAGLHLYTFNQVESTERWRTSYLERL